MSILEQAIFIDPSYEIFYNDNIYNLNDPFLNRDNQLLSAVTMRDYWYAKNIPVHTADFLINNKFRAKYNYYYSMGLLGYRKLLTQKDIKFKGFFIIEPPLVAPKLYKLLPELTDIFDAVYLHNIVGDGYSLVNVDQSKLRKVYVDQPYPDVIHRHWNNLNRQSRVVAVSGNQNPKFRKPEFYSKRIEAMLAFRNFGAIDLYGQGWGKLMSKKSLWPYFLLTRNRLLSIYKGPCASKYEILAQYKYALCFENMPMQGYITEKIFDCFYAGTVPIYLGAPDINQHIPKNCFIDVRDFSSWEDIWLHLSNMSDECWMNMRHAAKDFLAKDGVALYYKSYQKIIGVD